MGLVGRAGLLNVLSFLRLPLLPLSPLEDGEDGREEERGGDDERWIAVCSCWVSVIVAWALLWL